MTLMKNKLLRRLSVLLLSAISAVCPFPLPDARAADNAYRTGYTTAVFAHERQVHTAVRWERGGSFVMAGENRDTTGRNHHIDAFSMWMAGGGVKAGYVHGQTDELGFNGVEDPAHVHDIHATMLHLLGLDHKKLTFRFQGRNFRLTDVHGNIVNKILA